MGIGDLRKRMTLQSEALVADGAGGQAASWAMVDQVWATLRPVSTDTVVVVNNFNRRITHKIALRYRGDVTTGMRFVYGVRAFLVRAVVNRDEMGRWLDLWVEEGGLL